MSDRNLMPEYLSEVFHTLRAQRRCQVIQILVNSGKEELTTSFVARRIAAAEQGVSPDHATGEPYRNVYNALSQTHLSTLEDTGLIIYNQDRQTVAVGPNFEFGVLILVFHRAVYQTLRDGLFLDEHHQGGP